MLALTFLCLGHCELQMSVMYTYICAILESYDRGTYFDISPFAQSYHLPQYSTEPQPMQARIHLECT